MRMAFHQPNYLPNLSFFFKMASVDLFVITTNLQFVRREWQSRAKLPNGAGDQWITIPVLGPSRQMIREARINNGEPWRRKHRGTIANHYRSALDQKTLDQIVGLYDVEYDMLADLNVSFIFAIRSMLGIETEIVVDREVGGKGPELLINICEKYGADEYLSGMGGRHYMDEDYVAAIREYDIHHDFVERNVTAEFPYSSIHYLLELGADEAKSIVARPS